jgi:hypothetical protein
MLECGMGYKKTPLNSLVGHPGKLAFACLLSIMRELKKPFIPHSAFAHSALLAARTRWH